MARIINGTLLVDAYSPTGNPGEYTFTNALFENQADATGSGSLDVLPGFLIYAPAIDSITFVPVPGVSHRYVITSIQNADGAHLSATILWDEGGLEVDKPQDGVYALISETTLCDYYGLPPSTEVYSDIPGGMVEAAYNADIRRNSCHSGATGIQGATGVSGTTGIQGPTGITGDSSCFDLYGVLPTNYGFGGYGFGGFGGTGFSEALHNQGPYSSVSILSPSGFLSDSSTAEYTSTQYTTEWAHTLSENNFFDTTAGNGIFTLYVYDISPLVSNNNLVTKLEPVAWTSAYSDTTNASNLVSNLSLWNDASGCWFDVASSILNLPSVQRLSLMMFEGPYDLSDYIDSSHRVFMRVGLSGPVVSGETDHLVINYTKLCVDIRPYGLQGTTGVQGATGVRGMPGSATGIQGETGPQGATGSQGQTGVSGFTGTQGQTGIQGVTGSLGQTGISGFTGIQGQTGVQGIIGLTGVQGFTGIAGPLSGVSYYYSSDPSDSSAYNNLYRTPANSSEVIDTVVINDTEALIRSFLTLSGDPDSSSIGGGDWEFETWAKVDNTSGVTNLIFKVFQTDSTGGLLSGLFEVTSPPLTTALSF